MNLKTLTPCVLALALVFQSCQEETPLTKEAYLDLPAQPYQYTTGRTLPTLGRVLFYDNQLSVNNSVSCSSCHKQAFAFADNVAFSRGFENRITSRNSMPIQNLANFAGGFNQVSLFWDGRERNLQNMVMKPIANHVEMGIGDFDALADKLGAIPYYQDLFDEAFGTSEVTSTRIAQGLSAFVLSINSNQTAFDKAMSGGAQLSALEKQGQKLFLETYDCNACHQVQSPQGYILAGTFANIGLDVVYNDPGVEAVTTVAADAGKFKIPSLRNVSFTAPYMHDGRFKTLEEVIEHYSTGIEDNENLDFRLRDGNGVPRQFNISASDKKALIAFLQTLNDLSVLADPKFSNPFKSK